MFESLVQNGKVFESSIEGLMPAASSRFELFQGFAVKHIWQGQHPFVGIV